MRINNNLMSINAQRFMDRAADMQMESMVKLSSGYSINSAADNAAGLAISEKMRAQINGLKRAEVNAQDGISMMQCADGALDETAEILQSMRILAIQSANDTLAQGDRYKIQSEVDEFSSEITRISNTIEFNGKRLLNGGLISDTENGSDMNLQIGSAPGQSMSFGIKAMDAHSLGVDRRVSEATVEIGDGDVVGVNLSETGGALVDGNVIEVTTGTIEAQKAKKEGNKLGLLNFKDIGPIILNGKSIVLTYTRNLYYEGTLYNPYMGLNGKYLAKYLQNDINAVSDLEGKFVVSWEEIGDHDGHFIINTVNTGTDARIEFHDITSSGSLEILGFDTIPKYGTDESYTVTFGDGVRTDSIVEIDNNSTSATGTGDFAGITIELDGAISNNSSTVILDISSGTATTIEDDGTVNDAVVNEGIDVSTGSTARDAINTIDEAIALVFEEKAKIGALENRLEHVINNILTTSENLIDSESRIKDIDMAKEMMEYTRLGILMDVSQAMMAQANNNPDEVLSLLR